MAMAQPASGGPRTALWPLKADQVTDDAAYQVTVALRKELEAMLGPRAATQDEVDAARGKPGVAAAQGCMEELRCAETVANALGVQQLLTGVVRNQGAEKALEVRLVDVALQRESGRVAVALPTNPRDLGTTLRELLARLVAPEAHLGTLVLNGLDGGLDVTVDAEPRVPVGSSNPTVRFPLRVGKHTVELRRNKSAILTEVVDIRFEEIVVLSAPPPGVVVAPAGGARKVDAKAAGSSSNSFRIPVWVGPVVMALAVVPVVVGTVFLLDLLYLGPSVISAPATCQPWLVASDGGGSKLNSSATPLNTCGSLWRVASRKETNVRPALILDLVFVGIAGVVTVGLVGLGGMLLAGSVLAPLLEDADLKRGTEVKRDPA